MAETLADHILLNLQVLVDEIGAILQICHDTTHMSSSKDYIFRAFLIEESAHCRTIEQVELGMSASHQICVATVQEIVPYGRTNKTAMAGHIYLCFFCYHHLMLFCCSLSS